MINEHQCREMDTGTVAAVDRSKAKQTQTDAGEVLGKQATRGCICTIDRSYSGHGYSNTTVRVVDVGI